MNGVSVCLEEIALEGLDGITISTLWRRINAVTVWSTIDENYKEFLWRSVASCPDIQTYILEEPRGEILDFGDDSGIYPYFCINESGVRGSCKTFNTRKLIDASNLSLQAVVETFGNRLVLVASQLLRNKALLGSEFDSSVHIPNPSYCVLEMIGRSRKLGRLHAHLGMLTFVDSKTLFSQVKTLLQLQLITKQAVYSLQKKYLSNSSSIIYLAKFHTEHTNDSMKSRISYALAEAPECRLTLENLCLQLKEKHEFVERVVEDLSKSGHVKYVVKESDTLSDDGLEDSIDGQKATDSGESETVQLVHQFYSLCVDDDNEIVDEEWMQPDNQDLCMRIPAEVPIFHAIYQFVESKGKHGASLTQCCQELSMPFRKMRKILKDLEIFQVLVCTFEDCGNTRRNQYFATKYASQISPNTQHPVTQSVHLNTQPPADLRTKPPADLNSQPSSDLNLQPPATKIKPPSTLTLATKINLPLSTPKYQLLATRKTQLTAARKTQLPDIRKNKTPMIQTPNTQLIQPSDAQMTQPPHAEKTQSPATKKAKPPATGKNPQFAIEKTKTPANYQKTHPSATQKTHTPATQKTHTPATQKTHTPDAQKTQPSNARKTHPPATQKIQPPSTQKKQPSTAPKTKTSAAKSLQPTAVQKTQTGAAQKARQPATRMTKKPATPISQSSSSKIIAPLATKNTKPNKAENNVAPSSQVEFEVLHDFGTTVEESHFMDETPPHLSTSANNKAEQSQTSVRSRSEKIENSKKFLRRKNIILNFVKNLKVVLGQHQLKKAITIEENKMGLRAKIDAKCVWSVLKRCISGGLIKRFEANVKVDNEEHKLEFFCDVGIQQGDEEIVSGIRRFKDRLLVDKAKRNGVLTHNPNTVTGYLPKMPRCELLHIFLFYVIYELSNPGADLEAWQRKYGWTQHLRPEHAPRNKGWFTPYSVLLLLPVSLYRQLVGTSCQNHIVQQYLDNPATQHMLLKDLPPLARQILTERRKNNFLFASFEFLASFGLITPTSKKMFFHPIDIECYLHTSTVLKDTRTSEPAYDVTKHPEVEDFSEISFSFSGLAVVQQYWLTVREVCHVTPLNKRSRAFNTNKPKRRIKLDDLESLLVDEKEVPVCSKPRGDGLGAAGFDSRLNCHLPTKWNLCLKEIRDKDSDVEESLDWELCFANDNVLSQPVGVASGKKKKKKRKREKQPQDKTPAKKRKVVDTDGNNPELIQNDAGSSTEPKISSNLQNNLGNEKKKRKRQKRVKKKSEPKPKPKKRNSHCNKTKTIHDKRDEDALKQMDTFSRQSFTQQQQKLLFICSLALRILGKKSTNTGYSDWLWTRDILYKDNYESAKTKTALSISRKYRTMMANAQTKTNLDVCVVDCLQEKEFKPFCNSGKQCTEVMFNELVELLKKKYTMESMDSKSLILPTTMQAFEEQKNLYSSFAIENPDHCDEEIISLEPRETSVADIRQRIIRDAIVSACLLKNKKHESRVAFEFLSQFTEEELIIAIAVLKNKRIVVRKELRYARGIGNLSLCAFSKMLSSVGHRTLDNHFSSTLMDEAKLFYEQIKAASNSNNDLDGEEDLEPSLNLKFSESSILGGEVCCIFTLLTTQRLAVTMEVPENLLALEKRQESEMSTFAPENVNKEQTQEVHNETLEIEELSSSSIADTFIHNPPSENCKNNNDRTSKEISQEKGSKTKEGDSTRNVNGQDSQRSSIATPGVNANKDVNVTRTRGLGECHDPDRGTQVKPHSTSQTVVHNKNTSNVFPAESRVTNSGNVNRKRGGGMILDVLCGIEDHLFGSQGFGTNLPLYKCKLQPTSAFTCTMTTSDVKSIRVGSSNDVVTPSVPNNEVYERYIEKITTYHNSGDVTRIQFSINPCIVQVRLLSSVPASKPNTSTTDNLAQGVADHFKSCGLRMPTTIDGCINVCSKMFGYRGKDCQALRAVYDAINSSKEIGMSSSNVGNRVRQQHSFVDFSTEGLIKVLEAFNLVYQVGFVEVCYVTKAFKEDWFLIFRGGLVRVPLVKPPTSAGKRKRSTSQSGETSQVTRTKAGLTEERRQPKNRQPSETSQVTRTESGLTEERRQPKNRQPSETSQVTRTKSGLTEERRQPKHRQPSDAKIPSTDDTTPSTTRQRSRNVHEQNSKQTGRDQSVSIDTQTVSFSRRLSRPWITMAGEINTNAYNTFHRSVLAYIITFPGVQKYDIVKHFVNLVLPVAMDDILQQLAKCRCIEERVCYVKKTSLFSSKTGSKSSYYLAKPDATLKLMEQVFL